jgi:hypothetical protein
LSFLDDILRGVPGPADRFSNGTAPTFVPTDERPPRAFALERAAHLPSPSFRTGIDGAIKVLLPYPDLIVPTFEGGTDDLVVIL